MILNWHAHVDRLEAIGDRGTYTIQTTGLAVHVLSAVGHDTLPMIGLPPFGAVFTRVDQAKHAADQIDARGGVEPQMSGA